VANLARWMRDRGWTIKDVFGASHAQGGVISTTNFKKALQASGREYPKADVEACQKELTKQADTIETLGSTKEVVDLEGLKRALKELSGQTGGGVGNKDVARNRLEIMSVAQRRIVDQISQELRRLNMSTDELHRHLDEDGDGTVDRKEFVTRLRDFNIPNVRATDLGGLFDALDVNGDGSLSAGELALYIEGAKLQREQRREQIGEELHGELASEIERLFRDFDENGDGEVSAEEIKRALQACRMDKSTKECQIMIDQANKEANKQGQHLGEAAFAKLMMPFMLDELCGQEENTEEIRDLFRKADVDGSGYLTLDELAGALKAKQIEVDSEDLV
jgi:Ca2+-binding EF-hand superfamily protein